jgi:D-serine deaminase-like pyridoxal phosphate-dependent protein
MTIHDLETPALLVDLDIMERNLARVAGYAREHGLRLRPHTKTHKTPELGRRQVALGAAGLAVAKVGEAEVMLESGTPDLLVAYPVCGASKLRRLGEVARRTRVTVAVDSLEVARPLSASAQEARVEIGVLAEADVGLARVGVRPGAELDALIDGLRALPALRWEGVTFYPGHIKKMDGQGLETLEQVARLVGDALDHLHSTRRAPAIVSGGSTPTLFHSHRVRGVTEIRPGTYIFNDRNTVSTGACTWDDCAAALLCTVVSSAVAGQMILDGGSKTFFSDRLSCDDDGCYGRVVEAPEARFFKMNEEHGYVALSEAAGRFGVGDRVRVIPNHICVAVNLHERMYGIRGESVEVVWEVKGRGKLQ